jgi:hypothetical protein
LVDISSFAGSNGLLVRILPETARVQSLGTTARKPETRLSVARLFSRCVAKPAVLPNSCPQQGVPLPFFLFLNLLHPFPVRLLQVAALRTRVGNAPKRLFGGVGLGRTGRRWLRSLHRGWQKEITFAGTPE